MTQHEKLFESLPPTRLFFRCALPSMISMAMLSLYTVADGIFVGRFIGQDALAAVNLAFPLTAFLQAAGTGLGMAGAIRYAVCTGVLRSDLYPPWGKK